MPIGIIGGTGFSEMPDLELEPEEVVGRYQLPPPQTMQPVQPFVAPQITQQLPSAVEHHLHLVCLGQLAPQQATRGLALQKWHRRLMTPIE